MAAFGEVGGICSLARCGRQDFLPISCDACGKVFCQDHFRQEAHECEAADAQRPDRQAVICPDEAPESAEPQQPQRLRCAAKGCREILQSHNKTRCWRCNQEHCIRHRFEDDHQCVSLDSVVFNALSRARLVMTSEEFTVAHSTLEKVFGNILANPGNEKFRTLKKSNAVVCQKLRHPACVEALKLCGFNESPDVFVCPMVADMSLMKEMHKALQAYKPDSAPASASAAAASGGRAAAAGYPAGGGGGMATTTRLVNGVIVREAAPAPPTPAVPAAAPGAAAAADTSQPQRAPSPGGGQHRQAKTAFDFERKQGRGGKEHQEQQQSLQDLRALQKQRYQEGGPTTAGPAAAGDSFSAGAAPAAGSRAAPGAAQQPKQAKQDCVMQ